MKNKSMLDEPKKRHKKQECKIFWIMIRDELPREMQGFLLCDINGYIFVGYRYENKYYLSFDEGKLAELNDIVAFANLPEPPFYDSIITNDDWVNLHIKKQNEKK